MRKRGAFARALHWAREGSTTASHRQAPTQGRVLAVPRVIHPWMMHTCSRHLETCHAGVGLCTAGTGLDCLLPMMMMVPILLLTYWLSSRQSTQLSSMSFLLIGIRWCDHGVTAATDSNAVAAVGPNTQAQQRKVANAGVSRWASGMDSAAASSLPAASVAVIRPCPPACHGIAAQRALAAATTTVGALSGRSLSKHIARCRTRWRRQIAQRGRTCRC